MAAPSAALPGADGIAMRRKRGGGGGKAGGGKVGFVGGDGLDQIPPGKVPGVPEIAHVGGGYIQLLWAPPISVGSHSLSGYEICAREGGDGDFEVCHVSDDVKCATNVPVDRNKWLEFTVAAMSDAGVGPASRPSMPVLTRQRVKRGGDHDKARRSSGGKSRSKSRGDAAPRRHNRREPASTRAAPTLAHCALPGGRRPEEMAEDALHGLAVICPRAFFATASCVPHSPSRLACCPLGA